MGECAIQMRKWRDENGNVYGIEKAVRNKHWVVIRVNAGGNRKAAKQFALSGNPGTVQRLLDSVAEKSGWAEVAQ